MQHKIIDIALDEDEESELFEMAPTDMLVCVLTLAAELKDKSVTAAHLYVECEGEPVKLTLIRCLPKGAPPFVAFEHEQKIMVRKDD